MQRKSGKNKIHSGKVPGCALPRPFTPTQLGYLLGSFVATLNQFSSTENLRAVLRSIADNDAMWEMLGQMKAPSDELKRRIAEHLAAVMLKGEADQHLADLDEAEQQQRRPRRKRMRSPNYVVQPVPDDPGPQ